MSVYEVLDGFVLFGDEVVHVDDGKVARAKPAEPSSTRNSHPNSLLTKQDKTNWPS